MVGSCTGGNVLYAGSAGFSLFGLYCAAKFRSAGGVVGMFLALWCGLAGAVGREFGIDTVGGFGTVAFLRLNISASKVAIRLSRVISYAVFCLKKKRQH